MTSPLLLSRNEIDDTRWNGLIEKSAQNSLYAYSWYLDTLCDNWKALVWPSVDDYQIIMPLPVRRKWHVETLYQPLFCQYLGLFSVKMLSETEVTRFLETLSLHFSYISSYHFNPDNTAVLKSVLTNPPRFDWKEHRTYWLRLSGIYADISSRYSSDRKVNVKRSRSENWQLQSSDDLQPLIELFRQYHAPGISGSVSEDAYQMLYTLFVRLKQHHTAKLCYAIKNGHIHAGALFVSSGRGVIYLFNASDLLGRKGNARTFIVDNFIKDNAETSVFLDFESPEVSSIASFYKSFGAEDVPYMVIKKNGLPFPLRQIQAWRLKKTAQNHSSSF